MLCPSTRATWNPNVTMSVAYTAAEASVFSQATTSSATRPATEAPSAEFAASGGDTTIGADSPGMVVIESPASSGSGTGGGAGGSGARYSGSCTRKSDSGTRNETAEELDRYGSYGSLIALDTHAVDGFAIG